MWLLRVKLVLKKKDFSDVVVEVGCVLKLDDGDLDVLLVCGNVYFYFVDYDVVFRYLYIFFVMFLNVICKWVFYFSCFVNILFL